MSWWIVACHAIHQLIGKLESDGVNTQITARNGTWDAIIGGYSRYSTNVIVNLHRFYHVVSLKKRSFFKVPQVPRAPRSAAPSIRRTLFEVCQHKRGVIVTPVSIQRSKLWPLGKAYLSEGVFLRSSEQTTA